MDIGGSGAETDGCTSASGLLLSLDLLISLRLPAAQPTMATRRSRRWRPRWSVCAKPERKRWCGFSQLSPLQDQLFLHRCQRSSRPYLRRAEDSLSRVRATHPLTVRSLRGPPRLKSSTGLRSTLRSPSRRSVRLSWRPTPMAQAFQRRPSIGTSTVSCANTSEMVSAFSGADTATERAASLVTTWGASVR